MPTLREVQAGLGRALLDETCSGAPAAILDDGLPPGARLRIYRHHVFDSLTAALTATYPVVCRLVDVRFFRFAADRYIRRHPPAAACLSEYGAELADFLAGFEPCRHLPYLPDVARLEWAINRSFHAADATPLPLHALGSITPPARARLRLDPSVFYVQSSWPLDAIWRANQPGADAEAVVDLDGGANRLEVRRLDDDVVFRTLDAPTFTFRHTLARGVSLLAAATAALALDAAFDLPAALAALFDEGLVIAAEPSPEMETHDAH